MLTADLISHNIPQLQLQDTVSKALLLINDFRLTHLPVVAETKFMGLISEEDLLDAEDKKIQVEFLHKHFINAAVKGNIHFLNAVYVANQYETNIVAVVDDENTLTGMITLHTLLKAIGNFAGANEIGGILVLEIERPHFAISEISRIVEDNDCTIFHLNTTIHPETGMLVVTLHINKKEIAALASAFGRYEYNVVYYYGMENSAQEIHVNYKHLMNYLDL